MSSTWSNSELDRNEMLIMCIKNMPILYKKDHNDYKDKTKKNRAWSNVATTLSGLCNVLVTVKEVQGRWKTLKDRFVSEHKQLNGNSPSGSGQLEIEKPLWHYYNHLQFLRDHIQHRRSHKRNSNYDRCGKEQLDTMSESDSDADDTIQKSEYQKKRACDGTENEKCLEEFLHKKAKEEENSILQQERDVKQLEEDMNKLVKNDLSSLDIPKLNGFQCLLLERFSSIRDEKQLDVFNKLMDVMDSEL